MSEQLNYETNPTEGQLMALELWELMQKELPQTMVKGLGLSEKEWFKAELSPKEMAKFRDAKANAERLLQQVAAIESGHEWGSPDGSPMHTLEEISSHTGMSKERVRQVEQEALHKLFRGQKREILDQLHDEMKDKLRNAPGETHSFGPDADGKVRTTNPSN